MYLQAAEVKRVLQLGHLKEGRGEERVVAEYAGG
jgi:hypothetical protein